MISLKRPHGGPTALVITMGAAILALSACGSDETSASSSNAETSKEAGNLGTRVCVVNNTSVAASISFSKKDTAQEGAIPAGGRLCGEGTFGVGRDVIGTVTWSEPAWQTEFSASNPWIGNPEARISETFPNGKLMCVGQGYDVNESRSADNGIVQATVTRLPDDHWKEFEIIFSPSSEPSPTGQRTAINGYRSCSGEAPAAS